MQIHNVDLTLITCNGTYRAKKLCTIVTSNRRALCFKGENVGKRHDVRVKLKANHGKKGPSLASTSTQRIYQRLPLRGRVAAYSSHGQPTDCNSARSQSSDGDFTQGCHEFEAVLGNAICDSTLGFWLWNDHSFHE